MHRGFLHLIKQVLLSLRKTIITLLSRLHEKTVSVQRRQHAFALSYQFYYAYVFKSYFQNE